MQFAYTNEKLLPRANSVGLDPDEPETVDLEQFSQLAAFLRGCEEAERKQVLECSIPCLVQYALRLKEFKPPGGLHFSLQQQGKHYLIDVVARRHAHSHHSKYIN